MQKSPDFPETWNLVSEVLRCWYIVSKLEFWNKFLKEITSILSTQLCEKWLRCDKCIRAACFNFVIKFGFWIFYIYPNVQKGISKRSIRFVGSVLPDHRGWHFDYFSRLQVVIHVSQLKFCIGNFLTITPWQDCKIHQQVSKFRLNKYVFELWRTLRKKDIDNPSFTRKIKNSIKLQRSLGTDYIDSYILAKSILS